jgi:hypothetical protein
VENAEEVRRATEALGEGDLRYINDDLIAQYRQAFADAGDADIEARDESGSKATAPDPEAGAEAMPEATKTYYGNHYARLGTCFYWKTNGVGQPCGSGFTVKACNWQSVNVTRVSTCTGGFDGYRFVFTY